MSCSHFEIWNTHLALCLLLSSLTFTSWALPFLPLKMAFYFFCRWKWHSSLTPFGTYEQSSKYLNYLWTLSCHWWWHLFLLTYDDTFYLNSMFAHSTLRSWRSLEILKVCPEKKELKSCLWSVGISKKHQRSSIFSWLSSQKENWKKRTWIKCIFCWNTSELVFSQLSSRSVFMITPCAKI